MRKFVLPLAILSVGLVAGAPGGAQQLMVYPAQGQSAEQQAQDQSECATWARGQTGFSPGTGPAQVSGGPQGGEMIGGAARGAALGAVGGAIAGSAGKGAAIGAGVGAAGGLLNRFGASRQQEQAQQQANAQYEAGVQDYNRALAACLEGRGYTVN
jgi:hypothetical protein